MAERTAAQCMGSSISSSGDHDQQAVIDYCLNKAAAVFERCATETGKDDVNFFDNGDGENLLFILAQAELPPHNRTTRLLRTAEVCSALYNDSDIRRLTLMLAGAADDAQSVRVMSDTEWRQLSEQLRETVRSEKWTDATKVVVDWWIAATLRHDAVQMASVQVEAAEYLNELCLFSGTVAEVDKLWQKMPKQAQLVVRQENRLYFICHLFFVLSNWCRDPPLPIVAPEHDLRRWLAYLYEMYQMVMRNDDPRAKQYALEITVEIAMCLRFHWQLYDHTLYELRSRLVKTTLTKHGFVVMPNNSDRYHGLGYLPVADYHTHCLVAFFLTHTMANPAPLRYPDG